MFCKQKNEEENAQRLLQENENQKRVDMDFKDGWVTDEEGSSEVSEKEQQYEDWEDEENRRFSKEMKDAR